MRSEPVVQDLRLGKTKPSSAEKPLIGKENLAPKVVFDESLAARKESFGEEIIPQIKVEKITKRFFIYFLGKNLLDIN